MTRATIKPRKAPRQRRSQATVELILHAAARILASESRAGFNTNRVAEVGGVSVRSAYQYFPNKESLVAWLIDRVQDGLAAEIEDVVKHSESRPLPACIDALVGAALKHQYDSPLLAAALDHEERRLPVQARLREGQLRMLTAVRAVLRRHARQISRPATDATARDCLPIAKALIEADAESGAALAAALRERVVLALLGYLVIPAQSSAGKAPGHKTDARSRAKPWRRPSPALAYSLVAVQHLEVPDAESPRATHANGLSAPTNRQHQGRWQAPSIQRQGHPAAIALGGTAVHCCAGRSGR